VAAVAGRERTLGCVILIAAGMYEPAHAIRTDAGSAGFKIGEHDGRVTPRATALAEAMSVVAPTTVTTNLWGERWSKLAINCMANPIAGLSGLGTAELRTEPGPRRLAVFLAAEVVRVGRARGFEIEPMWGIGAQRFVDAAEGRGLEEVEADLGRDAKSRVGGRPSLLQDVIRKRRTEIEYLNGYVVDEGRKAGVATPFNQAIVELYRRYGVGELTPDPKNLEPMLKLLPR
jgi:2-dehydropantoate 2-reductase